MLEFAATESHVATALFQCIFPFTYKAENGPQLRMSLENSQFTSFQLNNSTQETHYYGKYLVSHHKLEAAFLPITNEIFFPASQQAKGYQRFSKRLAKQSYIAINKQEIPFQIHSVDIILCSYEIGFVTVRTEFSHLPFADANNIANQIRTSYSLVNEIVHDLPGWRDFPNRGITSGLDSKNYLLSLISMTDETETQYHFSDYGLTCISSQEVDMLADSFYGQLYYALLANLFHRLFYLKFLQDYACIHIDHDKKAINHLVYMHNSFTSNYFFVTIPSSSEVEEVFKGFKNTCQIDNLYQNTKEILATLFQYQQNTATKKDSLLLLVLTLYTVICGIFSMNLFTHDLQGKIKWGHFASYNPFEYFAVFIVFSGMIVVLVLAISSLIQGWRDKRSKKMWINKTTLSSKKH